MTTDRPVFSVCSGVLAASLLLVLSPSAYADDMGGLWPVKDSAVVSAHEAGLDGSGVKVGMYDMQVVSDYPGLSDAKVKYQVGSFVDTDGEPAKCMLDDGDLQATVTSSDSGLYYSHGTAMLMWLVGNGKGWDGSQGVPGLVPKADVMFVTAGRGTVLMSAEDCQNLARQQVGPDLMSMVDWGARVINMSNNGYMEAKSYEGMLDALRHGVIIVSGRSNDKETDAVVNGSSTDVMTGDPRSWDSFPGVIRNNEVGPDGNIAGISDVADANVNILSPGDQVLMSTYDKSRDMSVDTGGTSTGAAVLSGYLALVVQKWPDATGNQILQSLVRNTKGNDSGEAKLDPEHKRGYGQVDVARLLTVDPTQYPDVNPILEAQVTAAAKLSDDRSKWYAQDCSKNPDGVGDVLDDSLPVPCQAGEIGREYERQKAAWKKVEQCRSDGGSDCMRYSATATADETEGKSDGKSDGRIVLPGTGDGKDVVKSSGVPVWVWPPVAWVSPWWLVASCWRWCCRSAESRVVVRCRMPLPLARRRMRVRVSLCRVWRIRTDRIRRSMAVPGPGLCRSTRLRARLRCHRSTGGMSVRYLLGMLSLSSRRIRFRRIRFSRPNPILSLPPVRFPMSQAAMVRNRVIPHNSIRHNPMVGISPARAGMHGKP